MRRDHPAMRGMWACLTTILFRGVLDFLYVKYGVRLYAEDFLLTSFRADRFIESYAVVLALGAGMAAALSKRPRPSGIVSVLSFAVVIVPLTSLYGFGNAPALFVYAVVGCFGLLLMIPHLRSKAKTLKLDGQLFAVGITVIAGISVYVYGMLVLTGGMERWNFDLLAIYTYRAEYVETRGPLMGYFVSWQANIINMVLLCRAFRRRSFVLFGVSIAAQLLLFGMTGHKSFLFAPILVGGVYLVWKRKNRISYILGGSAALAGGSYLVFLATGNEYVISLVVRRLFSVPARLHVIYYDFFSKPENPFYLLSDSILKPLVGNPYGLPMPKVIAETYWGQDFWPNVGYLGDAFGNLGFPGMVIFTVILGLVLRLINGAASRLPSHFAAAILAMPAMALTSSALFTSMLTHGLIIALVTLSILGGIEARGSIEKFETRKRGPRNESGSQGGLE